LTRVDAQTPADAPDCAVEAQRLPPLSQASVRQGRLEPGHTACFALRLRKGEFVRASLQVDKGYVQSARHESTWVGGTFLARPVYSVTRRALWSDVLDALLFIRIQEPNRRVPEARQGTDSSQSAGMC
jgi:hypothetical protein